MKDSIIEILKDYSRLLRIPMLLLILAFQLIIYFYVVNPFLESYGLEPSMKFVDFSLLLSATLFITAGGYVISDYFDMKIDQINRPLTRVVGRRLDKQEAMRLYQILTTIGVVFSILLAWRARTFTFLMVMLFIPGILWFYSSNYKRTFFLGNFMASFLMSLVPLMVVVFQNQFMLQEYNVSPDLVFIMNTLLKYALAFSFVGFSWTFILEILHDMISVKGDRELECHTFPVVWGVQKTKRLLYVCLSLMLIISGIFIYLTPSLHTSSIYLFYICGLVVPVLSLYYIFAKAENVGDYKLVSKYVMVIFAVHLSYAFILEFNS